MKEMLASIGESFVTLFQSIMDAIIGEKSSNEYKASFGKESDLLSRSHDGFSATGVKQMSMKQSFSHLACISPSGGGKTTVFVLPTILRQKKSSLIINDDAKEIRAKCSNYLKSVLYNIRYMDFDVRNFTNQTGFYNPLSRCHTRGDVAKLVSILTKASSSNNGNDKFWTIQSGEVMSIAIEVAKRDPDPRVHHLASVYRILQLMMSDEDRISYYLAKYDDLFLRWSVLLGNSQNTKSSIFSSAIAALSWIETNPNLALLTSRDTISFEKMRKEKTAIFLSSSITHGDITEPLINCFYSQFFASVLEAPVPKDGDLPILCLMDEFGSSMNIPNYPKYASLLRKYSLGLLKILQAESQLEKYGKAGAKEILNSCTKIYLTGLDDEAERVSKILGKYSYKENKYTKERLLKSPEEIRTMPANHAIIVPNGGLKPIYAKLIPYYEQKELVKRVSMQLDEDDEVTEITPELHLIDIPELPNHLRDE